MDILDNLHRKMPNIREKYLKEIKDLMDSGKSEAEIAVEVSKYDEIFGKLESLSEKERRNIKELTSTATFEDVAKTVDDIIIKNAEVNTMIKKIDKEVGEAGIKLDKADLDAYRKELGVLETDTIAVGKTDVKGLEHFNFKGESPNVRSEAKLDDINDINPDRAFKAPYDDIEFPEKYGQFTRHAEEGILNQFDDVVTKAGLDPKKVEGILRIHQSNPKGVCNKCTKGLIKPFPEEDCGIFYQASKKYPNIIFDVTSEIDSTVKLNGISSFILKDGILIKR